MIEGSLEKALFGPAFEERGRRPFRGAVILGHSAYPCNDWLIPPFRRAVEGSRFLFSEAHIETRII